MDTTQDEEKSIADVSSNITQQISEHRSWYIFQGIAFVILGILAITLPGATAISFGILIGALLLASGFIQAIASFSSKSHWWSLISALLSLIVGFLMIVNPVAGTLALATILAVFLLLEGITELLLALQFRSVKNWGWLVLSGLVSLILGIIVFAGWPETSVVLLGVIIGVNLLLYGVALLAITSSSQA